MDCTRLAMLGMLCATRVPVTGLRLRDPRLPRPPDAGGVESVVLSSPPVRSMRAWRRACSSRFESGSAAAPSCLRTCSHHGRRQTHTRVGGESMSVDARLSAAPASDSPSSGVTIASGYVDGRDKAAWLSMAQSCLVWCHQRLYQSPTHSLESVAFAGIGLSTMRPCHRRIRAVRATWAPAATAFSLLLPLM